MIMDYYYNIYIHQVNVMNHFFRENMEIKENDVFSVKVDESMKKVISFYFIFIFYFT